MQDQLFWVGLVGTLVAYRIFDRLTQTSRHLSLPYGAKARRSQQDDPEGKTTLQLNVTVQEEGQLTLRIQNVVEPELNSNGHDRDLGLDGEETPFSDSDNYEDDGWLDFEQDFMANAQIASTKVISIQSLATLSAMAKVILKESVQELLVQRALETEGFTDYLLAVVSDPLSDYALVRKAVVVIQQLTKTEQHRVELASKNAVPLLCDVLIRKQGDEITFRYAIIAIYRIFTADIIDKVAVVSSGVLEPLADFLESCPSHNNDLKYWALLLIHSFCLNEVTSEALCRPERHFVPILGEICRLSLGNNNMQKMALHGLIRLTSVRDPDGLARLESLVGRGICQVVCACLKNEDYEIASWAVFLMHELSSVPSARACFVQSRGILRSLMNLLDNESRLFPRIILRILKQLGKDSPEFQQAIIDYDDGSFLDKILDFLLPTHDEETSYQAISLVHSLLQLPTAVQPFFKHGGLACLIPVGYQADVNGTVYIFEILSILCSSGPQNAPYFTDSKILDLLHHWLWRSDDDVKYTACALIMTLATSHPSMLSAMCDSTTVANLRAVLQSARESNEKLALLVAKTMFAVGRKGPSKVKVQLLDTVVSPLFDDIILTCDLLLFALFPTFRSPASPLPKQSGVGACSKLDIKVVKDALVAHVVEQESSPRVLSADEATQLRLHSPTLSLNSSQPENTANVGVGESDCNANIEAELKIDGDLIVNSETLGNSSESLKESLLEAFKAGIDSEERARLYRVRIERQLSLLCTDFQVLNVLLGGHRIFAKIVTFSGLGVQEVSLETECPHEKLAKFATSLLDLIILLASKLPALKASSVNESPVAQPAADSASETAGDLGVFKTPSSSTTDVFDLSTAVEPNYDTNVRLFKEIFENESLLKIKCQTSEHALRLLATLLRYKVFARILMEEKVLEILAGLLSQPQNQICADIIRILAIYASREGADIEAVRELKVGLLFIGPYLQGGPLGPLTLSRLFKKTSLFFYSKLFIEALANHSHTRHTEDLSRERLFTEANRFEKTSALHISGDRLDLLNDSWSFESIRANAGASESGKYIYEAVIWTGGIIQIGWATQSCRLDPEAGSGVGDDENSYAFDGQRCRIWHGSRSGDPYGREWSPGDVITCLLDLDSGSISYKINGASFGVAFTGVDSRKTWFPSVSFASFQACTLRFGTCLAPLEFPESGYHPLELCPARDGLQSLNSYVPLPDKLEQARVRLQWSPWLYYELKVGLGMELSDVVQMGFRDSYGNVLVLVCFQRKHTALVWIQGRHPVRDKAYFNAKLAAYLSEEYAREGDPLYQYSVQVDDRVEESEYGRYSKAAIAEMRKQVDYVSNTRPMVVNTEWRRQFTQSQEVESLNYVVLATYENLKLEDGDRVGMGACLDRAARFSINGKWLDPPIPLAIDLGIIPYVRNMARFRLLTVEIPLNQEHFST